MDEYTPFEDYAAFEQAVFERTPQIDVSSTDYGRLVEVEAERRRLEERIRTQTHQQSDSGLMLAPFAHS